MPEANHILLEYEDHFTWVGTNLHPDEAPACCPLVAENISGAQCHHIFTDIDAITDYLIAHV